MAVDFGECDIRQPAEDEWDSYYQAMLNYFPHDSIFYRYILDHGIKRFGNWQPHALYRNRELLGNVSTIPLLICWQQGRIEMIGIAAVATSEEYRRQGIAKHIMNHCLATADANAQYAVLFTNLPKVYESIGFQIIPQQYYAASADSLVCDSENLQCRLAETFSHDEFAFLRLLYESSPVYDGKVVRDEGAWLFYELMFNPYPKPKMVFGLQNSEIAGYLRFEDESDRLLITELTVPADEVKLVEALLSYTARMANQANKKIISVALPLEHFAWNLLSKLTVPLKPEPSAQRREVFMIRPPINKGIGPLSTLHWPLGDKF